MPPPEPRSSTVSPSCRSATAVGLPQPSEASAAASGELAALLGVVQRFAELAASVSPSQQEPLPQPQLDPS